MEDIVKVLRDLVENTRRDVRDYGEHGLQESAAERQRLADFIGLLRDTWRDNPAGRNRMQAFFVRSYALDAGPHREPPFCRLSYQPFWIPELTSSPPLASAFLRPNGLIGRPSDVLTVRCPLRGNHEAVVVGTLQRTESGPLGEVWTHRLHALCAATCQCVTPLPGHEMVDFDP